MKITCPNCNTSKKLKKILYGMPGENFDHKKYFVGGCMPSSATLHCMDCDWENEQEAASPSVFSQNSAFESQ
jgi:hypothetical protein